MLDILPEPVASLKVQLGHAKAPLRKAKRLHCIDLRGRSTDRKRVLYGRDMS